MLLGLNKIVDIVVPVVVIKRQIVLAKFVRNFHKANSSIVPQKRCLTNSTKLKELFALHRSLKLT